MGLLFLTKSLVKNPLSLTELTKSKAIIFLLIKCEELLQGPSNFFSTEMAVFLHTIICLKI